MPDTLAGKHLGDFLERLGVTFHYKTRRADHWWIESGGSAFALRLYEYSRGILRLTAASRSTGLHSTSRQLRERLVYEPPRTTPFEMSFLPREAETVIKFVVDHLSVPVREDPDWLYERHGSLVGSPFRNYHWTKDAYGTLPS